MTGRHAAPRDEAFDQLERDRAGAHRADVEVPLGPDDVAATKPAARAKAAPVKKAASATAKTTASKSISKKAGTS